MGLGREIPGPSYRRAGPSIGHLALREAAPGTPACSPLSSPTLSSGWLSRPMHRLKARRHQVESQKEHQEARTEPLGLAAATRGPGRGGR